MGFDLPTLADFGIRRRSAVLPNGARVVVFERPGAPVHLRATFLAGSRFDPPGKEGIAHFLEHMIVAGTKNFPSKDRLAAYIERYGGIFSASTWLDWINVNVAIGHPSDLKNAFVVLSEMLLRSLFQDRTFENERGAILGELGNIVSNPARMVHEVYQGLAFQNTELGRSAIGSKATVNAIRRDDAVAFFSEYLKAERMALVVCGGVTLEEVCRGAEQCLALPAGSEIGARNPQMILRKRAVAVHPFPGTDHIQVDFGFRTPSLFHADNVVLDVIAEAMGGGRASILSRKLRYERGLTYSEFATIYEFMNAGTWFVHTSVERSKLQEVLDIVVAELRSVAEHGLPPEEIEFVREKVAKSKRMEMQTSGSWVGFHSTAELLAPADAAPWTLEEYLRNISAVTPEDTARVAGLYFGPRYWYLALCGDIAENDVAVNW